MVVTDNALLGGGDGVTTGTISWNHDRESFKVTGTPAGNSASEEVNVWGAGAPDGSGAQVTWGGGAANPSSGCYRWVRLTVTVGGTAGSAGTITLDMDDLGGSNGTLGRRVRRPVRADDQCQRRLAHG